MASVGSTSERDVAIEHRVQQLDAADLVELAVAAADAVTNRAAERRRPAREAVEQVVKRLF